jgi:hypothetical protein
MENETSGPAAGRESVIIACDSGVECLVGYAGTVDDDFLATLDALLPAGWWQYPGNTHWSLRSA